MKITNKFGIINNISYLCTILKKTNQMTQVIGYPFVDHVNQTLKPTIDNPIEWLKTHYTDNNIQRTGHYKNMGYRYNFKPYLKLYVYKQYGQWQECYAPNKTLLRKATIGRIDKIIEVV